MTQTYPISCPQGWHRFGRLSPGERIGIEWREIRYRRRVRAGWPDAGLTLLNDAKPALTSSDVPLLLCVREGLRYLPSFLAHYRQLGVTRFIVLDDGSTDGTRSALADEPDVDLHASALSYGDAGRGQVWRDALIQRYGRDRWYLCVDIDEFLLFPGSEARQLPAFIADLERNGRLRAMAPMLDIYPDGPLASADLTDAPACEPLAVSPLIDGDGYRAVNRKFCTSILGGPRLRLFDTEMRLTKFPVIYADEATRYHGSSIHGPMPFRRNFTAPSAVLLHFKFSAHSLREFEEIIQRASHFDAARYYRAITEDSRFGEGLDLRYTGSMRVDNGDHLVREGFIEDLREVAAAS